MRNIYIVGIICQMSMGDRTDYEKRMRLLSAMTNRILAEGKVKDEELAEELARKWLKIAM